MPAPASDRGARRLSAAGALVALTLAAGCGGSDGQAKASYVERANRICAQGDRAAQKLATRIGRAQRGSDPEVVFRRLAELTAEAAATAQGALDRLAALTPPAGDEDELKAWLADQRRRQSLRRTLAQAFDRRDETAISTLSQRIAALGATTAAFADRYGVGRCARVAG